MANFMSVMVYIVCWWSFYSAILAPDNNHNQGSLLLTEINLVYGLDK